MRFIRFMELNEKGFVEIDFEKEKIFKNIIEKPVLEERKIIASYFEEDVMRLKMLLPEIDFSNWNDFM